MKKLIVFISVVSISAFMACSKKDDPKPSGSPSTPGTPVIKDTIEKSSKDYYFNFNADDKAYSFKSKDAQYMAADEYRIGGYQMQAGYLFPSMGLGIRFDHPPTDAEVRALAGKTIYFADDAISAELEFSISPSDNSFYSVDTPDKDFYVKINSVTFLKQDSALWKPIDVYVINGTCNAIVSDFDVAPSNKTITGGSFNFLVSRVREF